MCLCGYLAMWLCGYVAIIFIYRESPPPLDIPSPTLAPGPTPAIICAYIAYACVPSCVICAFVPRTNSQANPWQAARTRQRHRLQASSAEERAGFRYFVSPGSLSYSEVPCPLGQTGLFVVWACIYHTCYSYGARRLILCCRGNRKEKAGICKIGGGRLPNSDCSHLA